MSEKREHPAPRSDALGEALRSLPAERAGAGFTAGVLARLDRTGERSRGGRLRAAPALTVLAAAALAVAVGLALAPHPERTGPPVDGEDRGAAAPAVEPPAIAVEPPPDPPRSGRAADAAPNAAPAPVEPRSPRVEPASRPPAAPPAATPPATAPPAAEAHAALARVRAELDALRREHRRFEVGLTELPEIGPEGEPVLFVGGDEGLELVLDLGRDATGSGRGATRAGGGPTS